MRKSFIVGASATALLIAGQTPAIARQDSPATVNTTDGEALYGYSTPTTRGVHIGNVANMAKIIVHCQVMGQVTTGRYGTSGLFDETLTKPPMFIRDNEVLTGHDRQYLDTCKERVLPMPTVPHSAPHTPTAPAAPKAPPHAPAPTGPVHRAPTHGEGGGTASGGTPAGGTSGRPGEDHAAGGDGGSSSAGQPGPGSRGPLSGLGGQAQGPRGEVGPQGPHGPPPVASRGPGHWLSHDGPDDYVGTPDWDGRINGYKRGGEHWWKLHIGNSRTHHNQQVVNSPISYQGISIPKMTIDLTMWSDGRHVQAVEGGFSGPLNVFAPLERNDPTPDVFKGPSVVPPDPAIEQCGWRLNFRFVPNHVSDGAAETDLGPIQDGCGKSGKRQMWYDRDLPPGTLYVDLITGGEVEPQRVGAAQLHIG